jgi:hypothetical protein
MEHINRSHHRTFSLNIFRMNAQELIEIARRVNDPDEGIRLMAQDNREASQQTHREVTRRVHNFVAASLTLVEHTRIFMREHYSNTPTFDQYQAKVDAEFVNEPLVKFVQDLRNFMLHKGLPESEMFLNFESNPDLPDGGGVLATGIRIKSDKLSAWAGWSAPARTFIESSGQYIDIRTFAEAYTDKIVSFHDWLQGELDQIYSADLDELRALQTSMNQLEAPMTPAPSYAAGVTESSQKSVDELEMVAFSSDRAAELDAAAAELLKKVREIDLPKQRSDGFTSERPVGPTITDRDIVEAPLLWSNDVEGRRVFVFINKDGRLFGLDERVFAELQSLTEGVLKSAWARRTLSRSFTETAIVRWLQSKFNGAEASSLSETIAKASREAVRPLELWAPIAHLEVQGRFAMGPAEIATITKAMIEGIETEALSSAPAHREKIALLFNDLRKDMQGLAAVVFKMDGESEKIKEDGEAIARIVVGFLRFFSPAAKNFPMVCASALLGSEIVPSSNLLIIGEGTFNYSQTMLSPNLPNWRISEATMRDLRADLDAVAALVRPEGLSAFALAVRSSLLLFGTGTTFSNPIERLSYTLSSLEVLLLRHSAESVEFNLAERMGLLLAHDRAGREEIARNVREAYRLRARHDISPLAPHEMGSVATFLRRAHVVISTALGNVDRFKVVAEFVVSVDRLKTQGENPRASRPPFSWRSCERLLYSLPTAAMGRHSSVADNPQSVAPIPLAYLDRIPYRCVGPA